MRLDLCAIPPTTEAKEFRDRWRQATILGEDERPTIRSSGRRRRWRMSRDASKTSRGRRRHLLEELRRRHDGYAGYVERIL